MKKIKLLFIPYIIGIVIFAMLTADSDITDMFKGSRVILWFLALSIFYTLMVVLTNAVMKFVGSFFIKLANPKSFEADNAKKQVLAYMLTIYYAHLVCVYFNHYIKEFKLIYLIFIVPIIYIAYKSKYKTIYKKIIAMIPFITYIILDIITILNI